MRRAAGLAGLALLPVLAACGAGEPLSDADGTAAQDDDRVVLYSGRSENLVQPLIDQFEEETGITVEVRYDGTTALAALLLEEGDRTPAEVFLSQDAGALGAVAGAGLFAPLPDDVADAVPSGYTSTDGTWTGITGRARVLVYDGREMSEDDLPDSVEGLTDPEWRGRVGIPPTNASFQAFVTAFRVLEGEDAARAWLEGMIENDVQRFESNVPILEAVNSGRLDVGLINHYYWYQTAAEVGQENMRAQLAFLPAGDPGSLVNVTGAGILAAAADDPDALELVRYLVSEEGQRYFVENTFEYPLVPGIEAPEGLPDLEGLRNPELDLSDLDSLQETVELLASVGLT
jgi:iron(III) transport system substrate-binding protein